jgi:nitrate reductase gamma subunit
MRDELLFALAPKLALVCCLTGIVLMSLLAEPSDQLSTPPDGGAGGDVLSRYWGCSIAAVLLGHLVALAFPGAVLQWDGRLIRLMLLEMAGLVVAIIALVSLLITSARHLRRNPSSMDSIAATLLVLLVVSGLIVAIRYRWASSWAEVTLTPYVRSLLRLRPSVVLVARMPFVVQLHVFCAFAFLAIAPLSRLASALITPILDVASALAPVVRISQFRWRAVPAWTPVEAPVVAEIHGDKNPQH